MIPTKYQSSEEAIGGGFLFWWWLPIVEDWHDEEDQEDEVDRCPEDELDQTTDAAHVLEKQTRDSI